jgi:hypothetical protein
VRYIAAIVLTLSCLAQETRDPGQLIRDLGSDEPDVRDAAAKELLKAGKSAVPALVESWLRADDVDLRTRIFLILTDESDLAGEYLASVVDTTKGVEPLAESLLSNEILFRARKETKEYTVSLGKPEMEISNENALVWISGGTG